MPKNVTIKNKIFTIRGVQVMLDRDLAELYGVSTKRLNEQVKRNKERFPERFMVKLTKREFGNLRSHFATLENDQQHYRIIENTYPMHLQNKEFQCFREF